MHDSVIPVPGSIICGVDRSTSANGAIGVAAARNGVDGTHVAGGIARLGLGTADGDTDLAGGIARFDLAAAAKVMGP